jgi:phosphate transport system substrate-binding protein
MTRRSLKALFLAGLFALMCQSSTLASTLINGAGATFPYPLYSKWFSEFNKLHPDLQINYQSIGSGGGIRQFTDKTIDFGATDVPMTDEQQAKLSVPALHIPTVLGSVVIVYNLPDVGAALKLSPDVVADIFLGQIKKWDDARIKKLNPTAKLSGDIIVAHRSDGSGTSGVFTDYLSKVSPAWKEKVGQGTAVNWPLGLGGKGNEGVAGLVKQTRGSIGYVEFVYAAQNKLSFAALRNKAGVFVTPSLKALTAAASGSLKAMPEDFRVSITDADGKDSYPISSFTYLLVYKTLTDVEKGEKLVKFLKWAVKDGQKMATDLQYAPLPASLVSKIEAKIGSIEVKKVN